MSKPNPYLSGTFTSEVQAFILAHEQDDERELLLKHKQIAGVPASVVADQIAGRRKAKSRLPTLYRTPGIIYPPSLNLEQCSSEVTARFKAKVISELSISRPSGRGADLTGGFGVDSLFLSSAVTSLDYVEPDTRLLEIARHNHGMMNATTITHHAQTAEEFQKASAARFDFILIDPSRRRGSSKVYRLRDCEPDVVSLLPALLDRAPFILIKASPLLDLQQGMTELKSVEKIFVVAVDNECREVLYLCTPTARRDPPVTAVNLSQLASKAETDPEQFRFTFDEERAIALTFSGPLDYLYEPHAAILKAGAFKTIAHRFGLAKIQPNTHLYTSKEPVPNFPGRVFRIEPFDERRSKIHFPDGKANVFVRNYPLRPEQLRKKLKLRDGGEKYLIGFSGVTRKFVVVGTRI